MKSASFLSVFSVLWSVSVLAADIKENKIYHFYQPSCPHCHEAIEYINNRYPKVDMVLVDITQGKKNFDLFSACAGKFKLGNQIGTPLFCMGNHYIMGWSEEQQKQFDQYIKEFEQ